MATPTDSSASTASASVPSETSPAGSGSGSGSTSDGPTTNPRLVRNWSENHKKRLQYKEDQRISKDTCRPYIEEFVQCSRDKLFSVAWVCRPHNKRMVACMKAYMETRDPSQAVAAAEALPPPPPPKQE